MRVHSGRRDLPAAQARRLLLLALLALAAGPATASAGPVVVDLVARDNAHPNGFKFRGDGCDALSRYPFRFPRGARSPRLDALFRPGLMLAGPGAPGFGEEGAGKPFIRRYARLVRVRRRILGGRAIFELYVRAEPATCAGYTDPRSGAFVPGWVTTPLQVFGYYRRRIPALYTVDVAGTRRDGPPERFAIADGRVASGLRCRRWARQEASCRGRLGDRTVTLLLSNPEYCRGRVFYEDYQVRIDRQLRVFELSPDCRRLVSLD